MFQCLEEATRDPPGVTRAAYGPGEQFAHDLVRREGEALGAQARADAAGNLYLTLPGKARSLPALVIGSHLDSVPHGGNYDGAVGVIAGLALMAEIAASCTALARDLVVMAIRAEEAAWFPLSYPGSRAALGMLPADALDHARRSDSGLTLAEHMRDAGFDPEPVRAGVAQLDRAAIAAFIEVHIEQGPQLIARDAPVGIVTAIAGGFRFPSVRCLGAYAHSGAEPRASRRDSVVGFADLVAGLNAVWDGLEADGVEATITFGRVQSDAAQHGGSKVLGEIGFTLDVRAQDAAMLDRVRGGIERLCNEIGLRRGVRFELGDAFSWPAILMDRALVDRLEASAQATRMVAPRLASGAGHDAATFAEAGVPTAMLFVRNQNGSHNPDEAMDLADFAEAVRLLLHFVRGLAG